MILMKKYINDDSEYLLTLPLNRIEKAIIQNLDVNEFSLSRSGLQVSPISQNVLLTPNDWRLVDIVLLPNSHTRNGYEYASRIRDRFLVKKGLTMANQTGILTKTIQINGSMSPTNMNEINKSVFYMMHFNFSDPSTMSKQIVYGLINKKDEFVEDFLEMNWY